MLRSLIILAAIGAALIAAPVRLPAALGTATIADPQPGQALRGVVLIRGAAAKGDGRGPEVGPGAPEGKKGPETTGVQKKAVTGI